MLSYRFIDYLVNCIYLESLHILLSKYIIVEHIAKLDQYLYNISKAI